MIVHSVLFKLKYAKGTNDEKQFFLGVGKLTRIPGVQNLHCYRQTNKKNSFDFGITMEFESPVTYEAYNTHTDHLAFIENFWVPGVEEFLEIDYEPFIP
ncbi:MAG: Dabb family protein [Maribacter sp.]|nr:Dabb family protein [Maribacter sp.]